MGRLWSLIRTLGKTTSRGADDVIRQAARGGVDDVTRAVPRNRVFVSGAGGTTVRDTDRFLPVLYKGADDATRSAKLGQRAVSRTDEIAKKPLSQRLTGSFQKGGRGRKTLYGAGILGGLEIGGRGLTGSSPIGALVNYLAGPAEDEAKFDITQAMNQFGAPSEPAPTMAEEFQQWAARNPYTASAVPDIVTPYQQDAQRQMKNLEDYLAATGLYSRNQAQAVANAYQNMSQNLLRSSDDIFQRGQVTAADIDQLYEQLAAENLGTAYGADMSTPMSDVAGLAAPSGEMATSADVARTYGGSLADYLGQTAGIESAATQQMAQSQALQGAALAQALRDYAAMAEAERRFQLGGELSQREADLMREQQMLQYDADMREREYANQMAQQVFGFEQQDKLAARETEEIKRNAASQAAWLWATATPEMREIYAEMVGAERPDQMAMNQFVQSVYENPNLLMAMGG